MNVDNLSHFVYRYFAADGTCLYIGCTYSLITRHKQHSKTATWFKDAVRRSHQEFPDRWHGLVAERTAIMVCRPLHNKTFNYWPLESTLARDLHQIIAQRPDNAGELIADIEARAYEDNKTRQRAHDAAGEVDEELRALLISIGVTAIAATRRAKRRGLGADSMEVTTPCLVRHDAGAASEGSGSP